MPVEQRIPVFTPSDAAIYIRVSSEKQAEEGYSLATQLPGCLGYATQYDFPVRDEHIFIDEVTGTTLDRPGMIGLRDLVQQRRIQFVIVYKIDRFLRDFTYQLQMIKEFSAYGVQVLDTTAPPAHPTPERTLLQQMLGAFAEFEHTQILERTERGRRGRAQAGYPLPQMVPLGYRYAGDSKKGCYVIVEEEARIVRAIFRWYGAEGLRPYQIVKRLNRDGVPTHTVFRNRKPQKNSHLWQTSTVYVILGNETYIGTAHYGKTTGAPSKKHPDKKTSSRPTERETWIPIVVPPLVTVELFQAVQARLAQNAQFAKRPQKYPYLVGGGRMRCACCGNTMAGTGSTRQRYYRCNGPSAGVKPPCRRNANAVVADREIWDAVCQFVQKPRQVLDLMESAIRGTSPSTHATEIEELARDLVRIQSEIERWEQAYGAGAITLENFTGKRQRLEREVEAVTARLALLREVSQDVASWQEERAAYETWLKGLQVTVSELQTVEERQWLLDALRLRVTYTRDRQYRLNVYRRKRVSLVNSPSPQTSMEYLPDVESPWLTWVVPAA